MSIGRVKIGKVKFTFVFRHKFEKPEDAVGKFRARRYFNEWKVGLWYRRTKMVGEKEFKTPSKWTNNLVPSYTIGCHLLLCKFWVEWNKGGMCIEIDK